MQQDTRKHVAETVARMRERADLTQTELARKSGLNQKTISDLERATDKSPTLHTLDSVAAALGLPTWALLHPDLAESFSPRADALVRTYAALPPDGRAQVDRVADAEARYSSTQVRDG